MRHIFFFILAGGVAFIVDAGLLQGLVAFMSVPPIIARVPSFSLAVLASWLINSKLTFASDTKRTPRQARAYVLSMIAGGLLNWIIYVAALTYLPIPADWPAIALFPAVAVSMIFNYMAMRFWVFKA